MWNVPDEAAESSLLVIDKFYVPAISGQMDFWFRVMDEILHKNKQVGSYISNLNLQMSCFM